MQIPSFLVVVLMGVLLASSAVAAERNPSDKLQRSTDSPRDQFEYLVMTLGKTVFQTVDDGRVRASGLAKLLPYADANLIHAKEAIAIQQSLDNLGKFGWELVTVVGVIGGDQQMIFKRPKIDGLAELEAMQLRAEGVKWRAEKQRRLLMAPQCNTDAACDAGQYCIGGVCQEQLTPGESCRRDTDCAGIDTICSNGVCATK